MGYIIEKASGMQYADYLQTHVFSPAGMAESGYDVAETVISHRASGYIHVNSDVPNARYFNMSLPYAAGSLYSTVRDLLKWDQALYGDILLSAHSRKQMYTPVRRGYAYGWFVDRHMSRQRYWHNGGI